MLKNSAVLAAILSLFVLPAAALAAPVQHSFTMTTADPGASYAPNRPNLAIVEPEVTSNELLLVFLSGTAAAPMMYQRLNQLAAGQGGYHALSLDWVNGFDTDSKGTNIFGPCGDDAACFAAARQEAFDGKDATPRVTIGVTDSVLNRLIKALAYLDKTYPGEGWGAFLASGQPVWSRIVLAGHSNGSGEAAYIASKIAVARVALFSGPSDSTGAAAPFTPPPWMTGKLATPASLWYAFGSERDVTRKIDRIDRYRVDWPALGLGRPVRIDGLKPPFGDAHALTTNLTPCTGCTAHNMTASNKTPEGADGLAVFRPAWLYMLGITTPATAAGDAAALTGPAAGTTAPSATAPQAAPSGDAALPTPRMIRYDSNGQSLAGYLYVPPGAGPFPVYLWNHGSEKTPSFDKRLAKFWLGEGFVFFKPIRSGHGGNPGPYIVDAEKAILSQIKAKTIAPADGNARIFALHEKANEDVVNAYKWLLTQPFVDKTRIAVGGGSYGGIQTLMAAAADGAQKLRIGAFVAMSPAAESWRPAWGGELKTRIAAATAPIYLAQAHNDYNLGPTETLGPVVDARGAPSQCWLFPDEKGIPVKSTDPHVEGHGGFFHDPTAWGASVIAFLKLAHVAPADTPDPASPLTAPSHCSARE